MMTTSRLVSLDVVVPDRARGELIHLTGQVQVVARAAMDAPDRMPAQVALRLDAARVRGVGLKSSARYWAQGLHQSWHQARELSTPFDVVGCFELLGCAPNDPQPICLALAVQFRVTIPADGRVTVEVSDVELRLDSSSCARPRARRSP
jgi:hypothetical protein